MFPRRPAVVRRRPLLRAAAVGGGASMAGRATANRSAQQAEQEAAQDARISDLEQGQQAPQQPQVPEPSPDYSVFGQLSELIRMHDSGALTDAEFSAAKARLLGSPGSG